MAGRQTKGSPWSDEMHEKRAAESSDGEAALGYGEEDGAGCGGGVAADFGGVVDEIAGDGDCGRFRITHWSREAKNLKIGDSGLKEGRKTLAQRRVRNSVHLLWAPV